MSNEVGQQNPDGSWSEAKQLRFSWWVRLELWWRRKRG